MKFVKIIRSLRKLPLIIEIMELFILSIFINRIGEMK